VGIFPLPIEKASPSPAETKLSSPPGIFITTGQPLTVLASMRSPSPSLAGRGPGRGPITRPALANARLPLRAPRSRVAARRLCPAYRQQPTPRIPSFYARGNNSEDFPLTLSSRSQAPLGTAVPRSFASRHHACGYCVTVSGTSRKHFGLGATGERPPLTRVLPARSCSSTMNKRKSCREEHG
jgi:hypothetical protein